MTLTGNSQRQTANIHNQPSQWTNKQHKMLNILRKVNILIKTLKKHKKNDEKKTTHKNSVEINM